MQKSHSLEPVGKDQYQTELFVNMMNLIFNFIFDQILEYKLNSD